jgi:hypothetical protein
MHPLPELLVHGLGFRAAIFVVELLDHDRRQAPLMMEVFAVLWLLGQHLRPIDDRLDILNAINDKVVALKGQMRFNVAHAISVTDRFPLEVLVLQYDRNWPGVTMKYSPPTVLAGSSAPDGMLAEVTMVDEVD